MQNAGFKGKVMEHSPNRTPFKLQRVE